MLSIGEFSNICKVSTKTLRYYAEIGLLQPSQINPENGYRYYSIKQLKTMLMINRLKSYQFSLIEIKAILMKQDEQDVQLYLALENKQKEMRQTMKVLDETCQQLQVDLSALSKGKDIMSYLEDIDIQLVEVPAMYLLAIRKMVLQENFEEEYRTCFYTIFKRIQEQQLTVSAPPMVLFHNSEFTTLGMDTEFAIPIKECVTGSRDFYPGLCLKTTLHGSYAGLSSIYAKQIIWAQQEGYENRGALFEVYVNDPSQVCNDDLITEVYYPVKKVKYHDYFEKGEEQ